MLVSDPNSIDDLAFVDTSVVDSSNVTSGNSSGSFDWGGLFTSLGNTATAAIKATSSPQPVTVRPGQTYLNAQGQLVTVPSGIQSNTKTLIFFGIGILLAILLIRRLS